MGKKKIWNLGEKFPTPRELKESEWNKFGLAAQKKFGGRPPTPGEITETLTTRQELTPAQKSIREQGLVPPEEIDYSWMLPRQKRRAK